MALCSHHVAWWRPGLLLVFLTWEKSWRETPEKYSSQRPPLGDHVDTDARSSIRNDEDEYQELKLSFVLPPLICSIPRADVFLLQNTGAMRWDQHEYGDQRRILIWVTPELLVYDYDGLRSQALSDAWMFCFL